MNAASASGRAAQNVSWNPLGSIVNSAPPFGQRRGRDERADRCRRELRLERGDVLALVGCLSQRSEPDRILSDAPPRK
jgi:hypothetical protein